MRCIPSCVRRLPFGAALLFIPFLLLGCAKTEEAVSIAPVQAGPAVRLFDGVSLNGWVIENGGRFSVRSGTVFVDRGAGWLRSEKSFGDFQLALEFRFLEPGANSGIFVRTGPTSHDDEKGYPDNGYQIQLMDTLEGEHPLADMIPYGAPPFTYKYDLEAVKAAYKTTGEWQRYDITCRGEGLEVKLNGSVVTTATGIKNATGHVGIQGEGGLLQFRLIEVRSLK